jgi:hypothetical protein
MTRFRIVLGLGIVASVIVLTSCSVFAVILATKHRNYKWETTSPPAPDTLTGISRLTISAGGEDWSFEVTDSSEIASFAAFASRGTYEDMDKSGYGYHIRVDHRDGEATYYNHGNALGPKPGGFMQIVFVPTEPGFQSWFEELLRQHGHERREYWRAKETAPASRPRD